ncbi:MAG: glucan phosphoethanolaminetransferase (alkaline phosphatase superfamily) [Cryomorphaceae bacterium]|jgi:glucan phosphoethanolaminetransferase (alkaline phosphatase superfamily)
MSSSLILLGLFSAVLLMAINAIRFKKTKEAVFKALMIRSSIGFFVGFVTFLIPNSSFIEHYYGDHPEYMEAYKYWEANPNDPRAIEELQKEQMKFYEDDSNSN